MSNIPSSLAYIQSQSLQFRGPISESSLQQVGGTINGLLDAKTANDANHVTFSGQITALQSTDTSLQAQITATLALINSSLAYAESAGIVSQTYNTATSILSVPITTGASGVRRVVAQLMASSSAGGIGCGPSDHVVFQIKRDGVYIGGAQILNNGNTGLQLFGCGQCVALDVPPPGVHTYEVEIGILAGIAFVSNVKLTVREVFGG